MLAESALDVHGHALARGLNGVLVTQVGPSMTQNNGPAGSDTQCVNYAASCSNPNWSIPASWRFSPLPWRISSEPWRSSNVGLGQRERRGDPQPTAPQDRDQRPEA